MHPDDLFLTRAVELARLGSTAGHGGPFGAVVVHDGRIIGEGWNRVVGNCDPTAHAEIGALRMAAQALGRFHLDDCTLYASSEPCPMCLSAAYWAHIPRIVFANDRSAAAAIGFADEALYRELAALPGERQMQLEQRPQPEALSAMLNWLNNPDRKHY